MPFNFVEGFAVLATLFQWLRRLNACGVSMADAVYRYAV